MKRLILFLIFIPFLALAQEEGIRFEHNTNWEKVKAKAKADNKYIFVDCFTTWCVPCAQMAKTVFPQKKVGDFFNTNFLNLKIQMDQTARDNEEVKSWYDEAARFTKEYAVDAFPTFLIFNADGELVHRIVGGSDAEGLLVKAKMAMDPETQFVALQKRYKAEPDNIKVLLNTTIAAAAASDLPLANEALTRYIKIAGTATLLTPDNIQHLFSMISLSTDAAFTLFYNNQERVGEVFANLKVPFLVNDFLANIIMEEVINDKIYDEETTALDFEALAKQLKNDFPKVDVSKFLLQGETQYYYGKMNWMKMKETVEKMLSVNDEALTANMLNDLAWAIFAYSDDKICLQAALTWSTKSLEMDKLAVHYNTYANLLHKIGDTKNAIPWEEKALNMASDTEKVDFQDFLAKMKAGTPTWN